MILSIVIPAYNEEDGVVAILRRSLKAAENLKAAGLGLDEVEVILVSDGSRDRTEELARSVAGVKVVAYPVNRGYGAAIKTGFAEARGELLGFLDSDGTCDPEFFADLLKLMRRDGLDVALGSRMHPGSKMPPVRVLGNWLFRTLVNCIASTTVTDIASGMRLMKRSALERLEPLPDGLNYTPAMSVRGLLDPSVRLGEIPMPYEERVGRSKLSVVKDGLRFLGIILDTAVTYRPLLFFSAGSAVAAVSAVAALAGRWGAPAAPLPFYLEHGRLEDWMIFRVILVSLLLASSAFLLALGAVAQQLVTIINRDEKPTAWAAFVEAALAGRFVGWGALSLALAAVLNRRLLASYWSTGTIPNDYWVFPLAGSLCALVGLELVAFGLMGRIARLLREREALRAARR